MSAMRKQVTGQESRLQKAQVKKKKWTPPRFLYRGPKKAVEQESDIHFVLT